MKMDVSVTKIDCHFEMRSPGIQDYSEMIGLHLEAAPDRLRVAVLCAVYVGNGGIRNSMVAL